MIQKYRFLLFLFMICLSIESHAQTDADSEYKKGIELYFQTQNLKGADRPSPAQMEKRVLEAAKLVQIENLMERKGFFYEMSLRQL